MRHEIPKFCYRSCMTLSFMGNTSLIKKCVPELILKSYTLIIDGTECFKYAPFHGNLSV